MNRPLRIAVAEDEPDLLDYFAEMLPDLGHEVICLARNGRELVEGCRRNRPDLVITDLTMPVMGGLEAALEISREGPIPIIVGSGIHAQDLASTAPDVRNLVIVHLPKPYKLQTLEAAIAQALRRFEEFQDAYRETGDIRKALNALES